MGATPDATAPATLRREFSLLQATALNMTNMVGIGPFITLPLLMSALGGPQAMLGWAVALLIALPDGMVWSELGAALPGSGGSYRYLREGFGRETLGRLVAFLFIWQFLLSGPLEIASGYIGFAQYAGYVWRGLGESGTKWLAAGLGLINIALLFRRIETISKITVALWIGTLITTGVVVVTGAFHFDPRVAFDFPPRAFQFSRGFVLGLGTASRIALYDYLGYYDVCYIGDEVKEPGRVIPRSVLISLVSVALLYFAINLSIIGVVPWRRFVPADAHPDSQFVVSLFMERIYGPAVAAGFTLLVLWTTFGSVFALLLGYSRIPYAAARDGLFFPLFARLHPSRNFPHLSLLAIGGIAIACCFFSLGDVIDALIGTRILVQFVGQIFAVILLRRNASDLPRPYRIGLYPLLPLIALAGWLFVFATLKRSILLLSLGTLALGVLAALAWSWRTGRWPFATRRMKDEG
jgi:amino acid transporter